MRSSTVLSSTLAAFLLVPAMHITKEHATTGAIVPVACQNGNSKVMTGSVGNASCLSKIENAGFFRSCGRHGKGQSCVNSIQGGWK